MKKEKKKKSNVRTKAAHRDQSVDPELVCHPKEWYPGACRALNVDVFQLGRSSIAPTCLPSRNFAYFASLCSNWTGYTGVKKKKIFLNYDASIKSFREKKQKKQKTINCKRSKIKKSPLQSVVIFSCNNNIIN